MSQDNGTGKGIGDGVGVEGCLGGTAAVVGPRSRRLPRRAARRH